MSELCRQSTILDIQIFYRYHQSRQLIVRTLSGMQATAVVICMVKFQCNFRKCSNFINFKHLSANGIGTIVNETRWSHAAAFLTSMFCLF